MDIEPFYTTSGADDPLVCLHGNGEDGTYFTRQVEELAHGLRVICVDTRGHGRTPRGTAPFTLAQFAKDLACLLDMLGIESAHFLGFSDGANIALLFALAHPSRVKSLILNGGNLFPEGIEPEILEEIEEEARIARRAGDARTLELLHLMTDEPHIDPAALGRVTVPALVIAGTRDCIREEHTRLIAQSLPNAQLCFIEGGHFIAAENPTAFNAAVRDFLKTQLH